MCALERKDVCEVRDLADHNKRQSLAELATGIRVVAEEVGDDGILAVKPDTGDFVKWLRTTTPELRVELPDARRLALHSSDVWMPLVMLAQDVGLPVYLNLVSSYLYDRFKAAIRGQQPRVHLAVEYIDGSSGSAKRFTFEGDHAALQAAIKQFDINEFMNG